MSDYTPDEEQLVRGFTARHVDVVERGEDETFSEYLSRASVRTQQIQVESEAAARRAVKQIKADAWDEGFDAGERDVMEHESDGWDRDCIPNPYRKATHE